MILTETNIAFPLSSVKPLEGMVAYRQFCLDLIKKALSVKSISRELCPINGKKLIPAGTLDGLPYGRCPETNSLFLMTMPPPSAWAQVLTEANRKRQSPEGFHSSIAGSRAENVYLPKLDWIQNTLRIQEFSKPTLIEIITPPSRFTSLLKSSGGFRDVIAVNEMDVVMGKKIDGVEPQAAVLLESLDRVSDPTALLSAVHAALSKDGLLFLTALVSSGFDMQILGFNNLYLYPPDRTNCFTLKGLEMFLEKNGFKLLEVSTPGVLDVEIVQAHLKRDPTIKLSNFEQHLISAGDDSKKAFQAFLQKSGLSSFARLVGRKK